MAWQVEAPMAKPEGLRVWVWFLWTHLVEMEDQLLQVVLWPPIQHWLTCAHACAHTHAHTHTHTNNNRNVKTEIEHSQGGLNWSQIKCMYRIIRFCSNPFVWRILNLQSKYKYCGISPWVLRSGVTLAFILDNFTYDTAMSLPECSMSVPLISPLNHSISIQKEGLDFV